MLRAVYQTRGPVPQDVIEAVPFDKPELKDGEVLLEMLAAPINPSDILTLTGLYGMLPPLPAIGGNEGVGRVLQHGPNVTGPAVGQTVLLPVGCGTWATHIVAEAAALVPLPAEADPLQLSMITINPRNTVATVVGPPIMYRFVLMELLGKGIPETQIYLSLERRMKCGVGKCGHCQINGLYVCKDGPVFSRRELAESLDVEGL